MSAPFMFSLTAMTGRERSKDRTTVIGTVEMRWRVWIILIMASPVAIFVTLPLLPIFGITSLVMIPIVLASAVFLIDRRTKSGMKVQTYRAILDKKQATLNQFFLGGQPLDMNLAQYTCVYTASAPNPNLPENAPGRVIESRAVLGPRRRSRVDDVPVSSHQTGEGRNDPEDESRKAMEALFT